MDAIFNWNDAGYLREYLAVHYGQKFSYGGLGGAWYRRGMRIARRIARLAGLPVDDVIATARADAEIIYG